MKILKNISLKKLNTFGIDVKAAAYISITSIKQLQIILKTEKDFFILSGGSNMLLTKNIDKLVLHLNIKGKKIIKNNKFSAYINVNAGENWHKFVLWCIKNNFGGIENLSLIPGFVGTTPIQNIGAYGVEVKDTIFEVHALKITTGEKVIFKNNDCHFDYRDSVFKTSKKNEYIITNVIFKLSKLKHNLNYNYGAIKQELALKKIKKPTIKTISDAIITIRKSKLPDPKEIGNSGSFFKNPIVSTILFNKILKQSPKMPFYKTETGVKIPAGWLIEQCDFKGKRFGNTGVHKNQALVLVNYGNATGLEILALSKTIKKSVFAKFEINLETEVNIF